LWTYWFPCRFVACRIPARALYLIGKITGAVIQVFAIPNKRALEKELEALERATGRRFSRREVIRDTLVAQVWIEAEVLCYPVMNAGNIESYVTCEGMKHVDEGLSRGKGVMLVFGHFGANRMVMPAMGYRNHRIHQISMPATVWLDKMPGLSAMEKRGIMLREAAEQALPAKFINIMKTLRPAYRHLGSNEVIGVAVDGPGGDRASELPFLGRIAGFSAGAMRIAIQAGCTVLPVFMVRSASGRNRMIIEPPLYNGGEADKEVTPEVLLTRFLVQFEDYILRFPSHYLAYLGLRSRMAKIDDTPLFKAVN